MILKVTDGNRKEWILRSQRDLFAGSNRGITLGNNPTVLQRSR
jgi:hypothetical protein